MHSDNLIKLPYFRQLVPDWFWKLLVHFQGWYDETKFCIRSGSVDLKLLYIYIFAGLWAYYAVWQALNLTYIINPVVCLEVSLMVRTPPVMLLCLNFFFCPNLNWCLFIFSHSFAFNGLFITKVLTDCGCNGCGTVPAHLVSLAGPDWPWRCSLAVSG